MSDRHYHDHAEDPALEALSALYRQAPTTEPSPALDARILAMAREQSRVRRLPARQLRRWSLPLSLAAVLVLAVALVPLLQQESAVMSPAPPQRVLDEDAGASAPTATAPEPVMEAAPAAAARKTTPAAPEPRALERRREPADDAARSTARFGEPAPLPAPPAAPVAGSEERQTMAPDTDSEIGVSALAAPDAELPEAMAPVPSLAESVEPAATEEELAPPAPVSDAPARTAVFTDPERWLTWIRLLYRQGREAEAAAELEAFRRQFPDHPLDSLERPDDT